jgi:hypothetical protein
MGLRSDPHAAPRRARPCSRRVRSRSMDAPSTWTTLRRSPVAAAAVEAVAAVLAAAADGVGAASAAAVSVHLLCWCELLHTASFIPSPSSAPLERLLSHFCTPPLSYRRQVLHRLSVFYVRANFCTALHLILLCALLRRSSLFVLGCAILQQVPLLLNALGRLAMLSGYPVLVMI